MDLRIVFVAALVATGILLFIRTGGTILSISDVMQVLLDFIMVPVLFATGALFVFILTKQDPFPLIRFGAYQMGLQQLVSFERAIPDNLSSNLSVNAVERMDTDGDGFREWVVSYQVDSNERAPIQVAVYDNDRGNPPVIYPYMMKAPDRDYLGEGNVSIVQDDIVADNNGPNGEDLYELIVKGPAKNPTALTMFQFQQNSAAGEFPKNDPPRYKAIGSFQGSGGVTFDTSTKDVTVLSFDGFERSQLVRRSVYELKGNSYWGSDRNILATPRISTIDFSGVPPTDIVNTAFPEKIALAFYVSACGVVDSSICRNLNDVTWDPATFLAAGNEAARKVQDSDWGYFGLPGSAVDGISVISLTYNPQIEPGIVDISFIVSGTRADRRIKLDYIGGKWKIVRVIEKELPQLGSPESSVSQ